MYYKSDTQHNKDLRSLIKKAATVTLRNLSAPFVSPLKTNYRFIFVVGCGHSGTTLLASLLGRLKEVFLVGRESRIFTPENGLYTAKMIAREWTRFAEYLQTPVIVEKTPKHLHCTGRIWRVIPEAHLIAIVRNPVDNIASLSRRFLNLPYAHERWRIDNKTVARIAALPRVHTIKYEHLVTNPEPAMRELCQATGLHYVPEILSPGPTTYSLYASKFNHAIRSMQVSGPIIKRVDVWQTELTHAQARAIIDTEKDLCAQLGYNESELRSLLPNLFIGKPNFIKV
jgi:hypothetical protein